MKIPYKYVAMIILIFIFVMTGLFLPEWIATSMDERQQNVIGSIKKESTELPIIIPNTSISMIEKISLLKDYPKNVNQVPLETGTNFGLSAAREKFFEEIMQLSERGILPEIGSQDKGTLTMDVGLYVQKDEPFISGILFGNEMGF